MLAKFLFYVQLLLSLAIMVASMLWAWWDGQDENDCAEGEDCVWWVVLNPNLINALGWTIFSLTLVAVFLISCDYYINAKA